MEAATSVIAAYCESKERALSLLNETRSRLEVDGVALVGAAVVTLEGTDGSVRLKVDPQVDSATEEGTRTIDALFPESVRSQSAVGRQADAAAGYYKSIGVESNLLKELGENLSPTGAALVVLVDEHWVHEFESALSNPNLSRFVFHSEVLP